MEHCRVIESSIPLIEEILGSRQMEMGADYLGYKHHVYRMVNFCLALSDAKQEEQTKIVIAGCFHDLGIWVDHTFDYLSPSVALAQAYLTQEGLAEWAPEVSLMIAMHHKLTPYRDPHYPLVELFRQGDLVDFSLGLVSCGLPRAYIQRVQRQFPNAGFHKRLVQLELGWVIAHPLNPLPILKW